MGKCVNIYYVQRKHTYRPFITLLVSKRNKKTLIVGQVGEVEKVIAACPLRVVHGKNVIAVNEGAINVVKGLILENVMCQI